MSKKLRDELHDLKQCQIRFLTSSLVAAGLLLSIPKALQEVGGTTDTFRMAYLVPLVVVIPCWWGFFDKAKTITRIVGYYRVLEKIMLDKYSVDNFCGWENALRSFRAEERKGTFKNSPTQRHHRRILKALISREYWGRFGRGLLLLPSQRYWLLAEWTFTILAFVSLAIPAAFVFTHGYNWRFWPVLCAAVLVIYTFCWNMAILNELMYDTHSYDANEGNWLRLLGAKPMDPDEPPKTLAAGAGDL